MLHNTFFVQAKHLKHLCAYGTILHNMALDKTKQLVISQYSLLLDYHNHSLQPGNLLEDLYLSVVLSRTPIKTNYVHSNFASMQPRLGHCSNCKQGFGLLTLSYEGYSDFRRFPSLCLNKRPL